MKPGHTGMYPLKELDPQVQVLLERERARVSTATRPTQLLSAADKILAARQWMTEMAQLGCPVEPVLKTADFEIPRSDGNIPARLYVSQAVGPSPSGVLVYYHGGGFVAGDLEDYDTLVRALANRGGCTVVSVGYRLAPENPYSGG